MLTPTNSKITVASHVFSHAGGMYANPGIDEMGVQYVYIWGVWGHVAENFCDFHATRELLVQSEA